MHSTFVVSLGAKSAGDKIIAQRAVRLAAGGCRDARLGFEQEKCGGRTILAAKSKRRYTGRSGASLITRIILVSCRL